MPAHEAHLGSSYASRFPCGWCPPNAHPSDLTNADTHSYAAANHSDLTNAATRASAAAHPTAHGFFGWAVSLPKPTMRTAWSTDWALHERGTSTPET